jgi:hypothetical protein
MQDLKEIQIEIKKELGGMSLNHLIHHFKKYYFYFENFILLNDQNQALNIFGQSEKFQRELYEAIQVIKNINNK